MPEPLPNILKIYQNDAWGYEFRHPEVWYERALEIDGGQGVIFTPGPEARTTLLSVEVRDLGTVVAPDDLADLIEGFLAGLRAVPDSHLEQHEAFANPFAMGIDAVQTYADAGQRRKRWVRLMFKGSVQARVIAQGATVAEFDRLRPLFAPCMTTFMLVDRA
jgi:hypothetical protein